jgi:purine nucleoside phosphorylase
MAALEPVIGVIGGSGIYDIEGLSNTLFAPWESAKE